MNAVVFMGSEMRLICLLAVSPCPHVVLSPSFIDLPALVAGP